VLYLMIGRHWGGSKAGPAGWLTAVIVSVLFFGAGPQLILVSSLKAILLALFVLYIIWMALLLYHTINDAGAITAQRTAAVSGTAISRWGPRRPGPVAVIGAGVQARSHLPLIAHLLPGVELTLCDRDVGRLAALADEVGAGDHGRFGNVRTATDPAAAVEGATLVLTLVSFGPGRQSIPESSFSADATVVAVDYDMCVPASLARGAGLFLTDDRGQFLANRTEAQFVGYPEPMAMIGEAIAAGTGRPDGRVLVSHLGVGLADVVFADAILRAAEERGIGTILDR
ncbi:MAG: hypothetical protein U9O18_01960, partial [Chloroflexota bacterium]|nr:hypothetical protein [Chloroflexota bacterium]